MGGGSGGGTQETKSTPWEGQQPYLEDIFKEAQSQYAGGGAQYYPHDTVAPFSPHHEAGFDAMTARATGGSPQEYAMGNYLSNTMNMQNLNPYQLGDYANQAMGGISAGQHMLGQAGQPMNPYAARNMAGVGSTVQNAGSAANPFLNSLEGMSGYGGLGEARDFVGNGTGGVALPVSQQQLVSSTEGDYLGANPYLDDMYGAAAQSVTDSFKEDLLPGINAAFGAAGRTGSGAQALTTGRATGDTVAELSNLATNIYGQNYEQERARQDQAAGLLGQLGIQSGDQDIQRTGLASDLYLGERDLGQSAASSGGNIGIGYGNLTLGEGEQDLMARGMWSDLYSGDRDRQFNAGNALGTLGLGGMENYGDMYSDIGTQQRYAASMTPDYSALEYGNIDRLLGVGDAMNYHTQQLIDAERARWDFAQEAPALNLGDYSNIVNGLPSGLGNTVSTGSGGGGNFLQGAAGGAASGYAVGGPWGAVAGGILGGVSSR